MTRPAFFLLFAAGCTSRLTGNEGNLVFSYVSDDDVTNFNKPVAVGARLDLSVAEVGTNLPVTVTAASFDDASILDVADFSGATVTVSGEGDGGALLSVEATTVGGEATSDSVNMLAATPEVLVLAHTCTAEETAVYLAEQRVWVPFEMRMSNGQPVIGYGYYPVTVEGKALAVDGSAKDQQYMAVDTAATEGSVVLRSDLDDETLTVEVRADTAIDGVEEPIPFVLDDIDAGDTNAFYVRAMVGDLVVCQGDTQKTVESLTPDICEVRDSNPTDTPDHEYGWFEIEGVAAGTCEYTVTFVEGAGGEGVSETFTYPIEP